MTAPNDVMKEQPARALEKCLYGLLSIMRPDQLQALNAELPTPPVYEAHPKPLANIREILGFQGIMPEHVPSLTYNLAALFYELPRVAEGHATLSREAQRALHDMHTISATIVANGTKTDGKHSNVNTKSGVMGKLRAQLEEGTSAFPEEKRPTAAQIDRLLIGRYQPLLLAALVKDFGNILEIAVQNGMIMERGTLGGERTATDWTGRLGNQAQSSVVQR